MTNYNPQTDPYFTIDEQFNRYLIYYISTSDKQFSHVYETITKDRVTYVVLTETGLHYFKPLYFYTTQTGVVHFTFNKVNKP